MDTTWDGSYKIYWYFLENNNKPFYSHRNRVTKAARARALAFRETLLKPWQMTIRESQEFHLAGKA